MMEQLNVAERILVRMLRMVDAIDSVRPKLIIRRPLSYYRGLQAEIYLEDLAAALGKRNVILTY